MEPTKFLLPERDIPRQWYNVVADMPNPPLPPLHPGTGAPVGPEDLAPIFPMNLIEQEVSTARWIDIPDAVREAYALWRPTPLHRARRFERALGTPARIYYKNESVSPPGSHKPNTAVPQAYYNHAAGVRRLATETGAGQWGSALAYACGLFGLACQVYMVRVSYEQKPYRRALIETWGGRVVPSPSEETAAGRKLRAADPDAPGSLGIAISEAVEDAASREDTKYALGSVLNHVMLHQSVIGLEARRQLELAGEGLPDSVVACCGGGSNLAGLAFPFVAEKVAGREMRILAAEPAACPTLTRGRFAYDFGDTACLTPLVPMYTLGHSFVPPGIHSGGLRYHGDAPLVCQLVRDGIVEAAAYHQREVFEAALRFARTEGIVPAPETAHALRAVAVEAERACEEGRERVILFNLSGHGHFDMAAYSAYLEGRLEDYDLPQERIAAAVAGLEGLPQPR